MTSWVKRGIVGSMLALAAIGANAQESTNRVAVETDWEVFAEPPQAPTDCWGAAVPKETVNTDSSGRIKAVRRGDILLFVTYRPKSGVSGEISFTGGYPFAPDSFVTLEVGDETYELFTDGEWAWPASKADDAKILAAMKRGSSAVLTGHSSRGTITKDSFSLLGFTAATESASKYCGG
ncbi:invasion associated locus B family protein [Actibacterium sp. D379-3]